MASFNEYLFSLANDFAKSLGFGSSPRSLEPNMKLLNRYELIKQLGRGGMGEVWQAIDTVSNAYVALKFVPQDLQFYEEAMDDVRQMYNLVKDLQHPNICPTYGFEKDPNFGYFLVIKWLPGFPLDYVINFFSKRGGFPKELVVPILYPVACALDFAHSQQVMHRDIKPSNIFVCFDDANNLQAVWLIDFGLAAEIHQGLSKYSNSQYSTSGTRLYMPPEQWRGKKQDSRTDQYSLAVVGYEMLANELPFYCDDLEMLRMAILNDTPDPISSVPEDVNTVLQKALAKDRADRFSNCREFVDSLAVAMGYGADEDNPNNSATKENDSNLREAVQWCQKAAEKGDAEAQYNLGKYYYEGKGVPKDETEAVKWYRKSAEQGYAPAQDRLGDCYQYGRGISKNLVEAVKWYRKSAEQGYAPAQYDMGNCYQCGKGFSKDPVEAVKWFRKATDQGFCLAQYALGECYLYGIGIDKVPVKAVKLFRQAAEQGCAEAQDDLGYCYLYGEGISENPVEAVKWFRKAAEQGNAEAQDDLGYCYRYGKGVSKNPVEAMKWYLKAAEKGCASAEESIGDCFLKGEGVSKDPVEAVRWFLKAAQKGYPIAHYDLGYCLENGIGTAKNVREAISYYKMAAEKGIDWAIERLNALGIR